MTVAVSRTGLAVAFAVLCAGALPAPRSEAEQVSTTRQYQMMADRIARSLQVAPGERVMLRVDPNSMPELEPVVRAVLERAGASVETLRYGPAPDLEARLARTDVYVWLPAPATLTPDGQRQILATWVDRGGFRREIHFHWADGTRNLDAMPATHTPELDRLYFDALDIDYEALRARMRRAVDLLANREVRVTTPAGTDIRFRLGDRPFNQQDGDASRSRVGKARMRIDRHLELPAGILRVAPVEESVQGVMVFPSIDLAPAGRAAGVRLTFAKGRIENATAREGQSVLDAYFKAAPALRQFREFCIGFNPKLTMRPGSDIVPYYGYGDAVVRLSLGDNEELAGQARGGAVRWNFFVDATVRVAGVAEPLVVNGRLNPKAID